MAPVYLLMGNDSGVLANKVIDALKSDGNSDLISGFVLVDKTTGEFIAVNTDETVWRSKDH
jgi:hypothetical protein